MTLPIVAIRPEPGCSATAERAREAGLAIDRWPLFDVHPVAWDPPPPERIDGLLLGSVNAVRHAGSGIDIFRSKPAYAVGKTTASAAEAAGMRVADVGRTTLQALLDTLPPPLTLLRVAGEERVALRPPPGIVIETRVAYRTVASPMPQGLAERLRSGALVLLHSAAAARHFGQECDRLGVARMAVAVAALGARIAEAAGAGWRACRSATEPHDAALLALARDMCHDLRPG